MPIRFKKANGIFTSEQELICPLIYFDMWAYHEIIRDNNMSLILDILNDEFGTLCLSETDIIEIAQGNREDVYKIKKFISDTPFIFFDDNPLNDNTIKPLEIFYEHGLNIDAPQDLLKILIAMKSPTKGYNKAQDDIVKWINDIRKNETAKIKNKNNVVQQKIYLKR